VPETKAPPTQLAEFPLPSIKATVEATWSVLITRHEMPNDLPGAIVPADTPEVKMPELNTTSGATTAAELANVFVAVRGENWSPDDRFTPPAEFHADTITL
jgi:hypothetical protein